MSHRRLPKWVGCSPRGFLALESLWRELLGTGPLLVLFCVDKAAYCCFCWTKLIITKCVTNWTKNISIWKKRVSSNRLSFTNPRSTPKSLQSIHCAFRSIKHCVNEEWTEVFSIFYYYFFSLTLRPSQGHQIKPALPPRQGSLLQERRRGFLSEQQQNDIKTLHKKLIVRLIKCPWNLQHPATMAHRQNAIHSFWTYLGEAAIHSGFSLNVLCFCQWNSSAVFFI